MRLDYFSAVIITAEALSAEAHGVQCVIMSELGATEFTQRSHGSRSLSGCIEGVSSRR